MAKEKIPMEFLIIPALEQAAANGFAEENVNTPVSRTETLAMMIHELEVQTPIDLDGITNQDNFIFQFTNASKTDIINMDDVNLLARLGVVQTITTSGAAVYEATMIRKFDPPVLYAKKKIFAGFKTAGQAAAKSAVYSRVGYTLEKVSKDVFIQSLVD